MSRWKYGSYEFRINPNSFSQSVQVVGDNVRTLTGALISQPTGLLESYEVQSVFYQPRTRIVDTLAMSGATCIDSFGGNIYLLNKTANTITVYNRNFAVQSTISLAAIPVSNRTYISMDVVDASSIWVVSRMAGGDHLYKINMSGTITWNYLLPSVAGSFITSLVELDGYLFAIRGNMIDRLVVSGASAVKVAELSIPLTVNGAKAISSVGNYLIVGCEDGTYGNVIYYINHGANSVVNAVTTDGIISINDIGFDGTYLLVLNSTSNTVQRIVGNTVLLDIAELEREIESNGFVNMIDDMEISRRVAITNMSKERKLGYEQMYNISLSVEKVIRG